MWCGKIQSTEQTYNQLFSSFLKAPEATLPLLELAKRLQIWILLAMSEVYKDIQIASQLPLSIAQTDAQSKPV